MAGHQEEGSATLRVNPCNRCPLRRSAAFKDASPGQVEAIEKMRHGQLSLAAGADIVVAGEENANLYTLFSGWAFRCKELEDGRRQILNFLLPGDLVGLQAAMFEPSQHSIIALTDVTLCRFPRKRVWKLFSAVPELAFDITWLGAHEESVVDNNMLAVGQLTAEEKVAALILNLFKRLEALGLVKGMSFQLPLTQLHMADALGLSLAHLNKTIARLKRRNLFISDGPIVTLKNPKALERTAQIYASDYQRRPLL